MMKMDYQSKKKTTVGATRSASGIETSSKYSRGYNKTVSGKSRQEENFEDMEIEEIDVLIEKA